MNHKDLNDSIRDANRIFTLECSIRNLRKGSNAWCKKNIAAKRSLIKEIKAGRA